MVRIITMAHSTRFSSSSRILVALVAGLLSLLCGEEGVLHVQSFSTIVSFHPPTSLTTKTTTTTTRSITHIIGSTASSSSSSSSFPSSSSSSSSTLFSTATETEADIEIKVETEKDIDIDLSESIPTTKITIEKDVVVLDDVVDDVSSQSQESSSSSSESESSSTSESSSESTSLYNSLSEVLLGPNKYRQLLEFVEPTTNVTVLLIGSMHYNPASIDLVETTVEKLGLEDKLGSVIIESCDIRWNKTQTIRDEKNTKLQEKQAKAEAQQAEEESQTSASSSVSSSQPSNITLNKDDLLGNEMVAAWEVASKYNRPTVLGDQRINITMDALKANFKDTLSDIFLKGPKGWKNSYTEIVEGWEQTIPIDVSRSNNNDDDGNSNNNEVQNLNALAFFDPRLLISLPVSLVKYPLSFLLKDPLPFTLFFGTIAGLSYYFDHTGQLYDLMSSSMSSPEYYYEAGDVEPHSIASYLVSLVFSLLETVIFARLLLKPLLAERNEILAKSILDQCTIYSTTMDETSSTNGNGGTNSNWFEQFFFKFTGGTINNNNNSNNNEQNIDTDAVDGIVYVPGSSPSEMKMKSTIDTTTTTTTFYEGENKEGKVVVAVLGMAHCNGVMKLLTEQRV